MQEPYKTTMRIFCLENQNILNHVTLIFFSKLFLARVHCSPRRHAKLLGVKKYVLEAYCKMEKHPCFTVHLLINNLIIYIT